MLPPITGGHKEGAGVGHDMETLRAAAYQRAQGHCEITGLPLGESWALHHRRVRGMGGSRRADTNTLPNVLAITHEVHNLRSLPGHPAVHLDVAWARQHGYLISQAADPQKAPVEIAGQGWTLLTCDGGYQSCDPPGME